MGRVSYLNSFGIHEIESQEVKNIFQHPHRVSRYVLGEDHLGTTRNIGSVQPRKGVSNERLTPRGKNDTGPTRSKSRQPVRVVQQQHSRFYHTTHAI